MILVIFMFYNQTSQCKFVEKEKNVKFLAIWVDNFENRIDGISFLLYKMASWFTTKTASLNFWQKKRMIVLISCLHRQNSKIKSPHWFLLFLFFGCTKLFTDHIKISLFGEHYKPVTPNHVRSEQPSVHLSAKPLHVFQTQVQDFNGFLLGSHIHIHVWWHVDVFRLKN